MPYALFNLGRMLSTAEQHTEAQRVLQGALTLNPSLSEAHQELGAVLFAQHRIPEALPHFFKAVELAPGSLAALSDLGGALAQAGRTREAAEHLRRALAIDPANDAARQNLTWLFSKDHPIDFACAILRAVVSFRNCRHENGFWGSQPEFLEGHQGDQGRQVKAY